MPYFVTLCGDAWDPLKEKLGDVSKNDFLDNDVLGFGAPWWGWHQLGSDWHGMDAPTAFCGPTYQLDQHRTRRNGAPGRLMHANVSCSPRPTCSWRGDGVRCVKWGEALSSRRSNAGSAVLHTGSS